MNSRVICTDIHLENFKSLFKYNIDEGVENRSENETTAFKETRCFYEEIQKDCFNKLL